ncbi:MAG TPA: tannase/feruloyl esterase family alpha/beta hydrolase [Bryobacteraceae bacterium]|nr:tannase/feruloyl esterase family alpha/beta hydrolase [Bryobacteraceae bacterium]
MKKAVWLLAGVVCATAGAPAFGVPCANLSVLPIKNGTITSADVVAAGAFAPAQGRGPVTAYRKLPPFCRISGTLRPAADSHVGIEVWMPETGWNGKLQSVGNGAWAGSISYPAMATALAAGYATASTDTGHTGNSGRFVLEHPEEATDFAYRAVHEMTVAAKALIAAFYASGPKYSYWNGCSTGGRQALVEAQRYPGDYDGIIAGAPANYVTHLQGMQVWAAQQAHRSEASLIPAAKLAALHRAALAACDAHDGVTDGVIEDPRECRFDPKVLACKNGDGPNCLTQPQLETAAKLYAGPTDPRTGAQLFPGLEPGSETGWAMVAGPQPMSLAVEVYQYLVHQDPAWDYRSFDPAKDVALADQKIAKTWDSTDPNLRPFFAHGGKLLMYHGWADPGIPPLNSVAYYTSVVKNVGADGGADSIRLFMVPGMGHCRGGDGTDTFDPVQALDEWVGSGRPPDHIPASRVRNGASDRTRPLCPYPQTAHYQGTGSTDEAANFSCK